LGPKWPAPTLFGEEAPNKTLPKISKPFFIFWLKRAHQILVHVDIPYALE